MDYDATAAARKVWYCPYCSFTSECPKKYSGHLQIHIDGIQQCVCGKLFETKVLHKAHTKRTNCMYIEKRYITELYQGPFEQHEEANVELCDPTIEPLNEQIEENNSFDSDDAESDEKIDEQSLCFLTSLCADGNISRKAAIDIYKKSKKMFFDPVIKYIERRILPELTTLLKKGVTAELLEMNQKLKLIDSEYKLEKILTDKGVYNKPIVTEIDARMEAVRKGDEMVTVRNAVEIVTNDIIQKFELFLRSRNVYASMTNYYNQVKDSKKLKNFINGSMWKGVLEKHPEKNMLPFFLFFDDFVYGNQLSKKKKATSISGFYAIFPTLPPELRSQINSILTVATIETSKIKENGFEKCLSPVVDAFDCMEKEGIEIKKDDGTTETVYPVLVQILGDNKGLNEILGIVGSFISKCHCRTCYEEIDLMRCQVEENTRKLRNEESHRLHLDIYDPTETGVKSDCCFNRLEVFKSYNNKVIDVHHDFLHGCCNFIICPILLNFIKAKILDLERLNILRQNFVAVSGGRNVSKVDFTMDNLTKENLPLNAVEMMQFTIFLPLILDHIIQDKESNDWKLLIFLVEALETVWLPEHDEESLLNLDICIKNLLQLYFTHIKPHFKHKLHNLVHIISAIRAIGPTAHYSALRGEAKHQDVKRIINSSNSRVNIPITVARKEGFKAALHSFDSLNSEHRISYGKRIKFSQADRIALGPSILQHNLKLDNTFETGKIDFHGVLYKENYYIFEDNQIYRIVKLFTDSKRHVIYCKLERNFEYQPQLRCHKQFTRRDTLDDTFKFFDLNKTSYAPSLLIDLASGQRVVKFYRQLERF